MLPYFIKNDNAVAYNLTSPPGIPLSMTAQDFAACWWILVRISMMFGFFFYIWRIQTPTGTFYCLLFTVVVLLWTGLFSSQFGPAQSQICSAWSLNGHSLFSYMAHITHWQVINFGKHFIGLPNLYGLLFRAGIKICKHKRTVKQLKPFR